MQTKKLEVVFHLSTIICRKKSVYIFNDHGLRKRENHRNLYLKKFPLYWRVYRATLMSKFHFDAN